uniref:Metalloendopeptidase n=1 Tax=Ciona savignyi TaxID=51511 RepID=H2YK94_CIOSA
FPDNRSFEVFAGNSITFDRDKWELGANGRIQVPYIFNPGLNSKAHFAVNSAADFLARWTCIDLNKRKKERRYIRFIRGDGCSSRIGRGFGVQDIHLAFGCEHRGIVLHEVFHAIGFYHEQARPDRDRYIEVFLNNVYPRHRHNYHKMNPANVANLGFGYDLRSFLHYESHAFQKDQISPTFIVRSTGLPMYLAANNPSDIDIAEVDTLYRCPIKAADRRGSWGPWKAWSACYDGCSSIKITKIRYRFCKNARGGHATSCPGSNTNSGICKRKIYACKPKYSQWT